MASNDQRHEYKAITNLTRDEVAIRLLKGDPRELQYVAVSVALFSDDLSWAQEVCVQLAEHPDPLVRGNALLGFGHIARRFGELNLDIIMPIVDRARHDPEEEEYVRFQANDAFDDIQHYVR